MRYFYNTKTKLQIIDVSGEKPVEQITYQFGGKAEDYQILDMTKQEEINNVVAIVDNKLIKQETLVPVNTHKQNYDKLTTQAQKTDFIAERLGLK